MIIPINTCLEKLNKQSKSIETQLNRIHKIKQLYPDCLVNSTAKNLTIFSNNVLEDPNLTFSVNRHGAHAITVSLFTKVKVDGVAFEIYPYLPKKYGGYYGLLKWTIITQSYRYDRNNYNNNHYILDLNHSYKDFEVILKKLPPDKIDKIYQAIFVRVVDIMNKSKQLPSQNIIKLFPKIEKYIALL